MDYLDNYMTSENVSCVNTEMVNRNVCQQYLLTPIQGPAQHSMNGQPKVSLLEGRRHPAAGWEHPRACLGCLENLGKKALWFINRTNRKHNPGIEDYREIRFATLEEKAEEFALGAECTGLITELLLTKRPRLAYTSRLGLLKDRQRTRGEDMVLKGLEYCLLCNYHNLWE